MNRQKFLEIVLTACIGALISILQNILSAHFGNSETIISPASTGVVAGSLQMFRQMKYV